MPHSFMSERALLSAAVSKTYRYVLLKVMQTIQPKNLAHFRRGQDKDYVKKKVGGDTFLFRTGATKVRVQVIGCRKNDKITFANI